METSTPNIATGIASLPTSSLGHAELNREEDTKLQRALDRIPLRLTQLAVTPRVLLNVARGYLEPEVHQHLDFGNIRNHGLQDTRVVTNSQQAQHQLRQAYKDGRPVHVAAARHSSNGHTLAPQGATQLQLDPSAWGAPRWVENQDLEVPACMSWREVKAFAQKQGRTLPVLTDRLGSTVGGTLSAGGGIGGRSVIAGRQIDHVQSLRLIFPNGDAQWISPMREPELFSFVLGGQGTLGIIDRVVIRTVVYRPYTTEFKLQFRSIVDAARAAQALCNRDDLPENFAYLDFVGPVLNTRVVELSLGFEFATRQEALKLRSNLPSALAIYKDRIVKRQVVKDMAQHNSARSSAYLSTLTKASNKHRFFCNHFFFADPQEYMGFLHHLENNFFRRVGNQHLMAAQGLSFQPTNSKQRFPLSGLEYRPNQRAWSIGLNYGVPERLYAHCELMERAFEEIQNTCHEMGGRIYRCGYSNADAQTFSKVYGQDYEELRALKQRVDPQYLLNPGVLGLKPEVAVPWRSGDDDCPKAS